LEGGGHILKEEMSGIYLEDFRRNLKNLSRDELYPGMASKRPSRIEIVE
jgi:hypothetical protein